MLVTPRDHRRADLPDAAPDEPGRRRRSRARWRSSTRPGRSPTGSRPTSSRSGSPSAGRKSYRRVAGEPCPRRCGGGRQAPRRRRRRWTGRSRRRSATCRSFSVVTVSPATDLEAAKDPLKVTAEARRRRQASPGPDRRAPGCRRPCARQGHASAPTTCSCAASSTTASWTRSTTGVRDAIVDARVRRSGLDRAAGRGAHPRRPGPRRAP